MDNILDCGVILADKKHYYTANDLISGNELDKAWQTIHQIQSDTLRKSFFEYTGEINTGIKDKIRYEGYYKGCDGNIHSYDDSGGSSYGGSGGGGDDDACGSICGGIGCIIVSICCSMQIHECCWCALWDLFWDIADFCF